MNYGTVSFIGAGPGDPELLTLKGKAAIEEAALVLYAGALVSREVIAFASKNAEIHDAALLTLEKSHTLVRKSALAGLPVAHVHTGDPAIYGPLAEQIELLDRDGIPWRIIPGVTAATAAAASAGLSFSIPGKSQSLLITRIAGRTPMPGHEQLAELARTGVAMAIYLSGHKCADVQAELEQALPSDTPVICASRIGWPEEQIIGCTVASLAECGYRHGLGRQTVLLVLPGHNRLESRLRLFHSDFNNGFRKAQPWTS